MKRNVLTQYLIITASCALYAVGFNWMFDPNHISVGGFTGLGQIINYLLPGLPIGTIVIILNVPLFVLGWRFIGKDFLFSSVYATAVSSLMIDGLAAVHTFKPMEPILAICSSVTCFSVTLRTSPSMPPTFRSRSCTATPLSSERNCLLQRVVSLSSRIIRFFLLFRISSASAL